MHQSPKIVCHMLLTFLLSVINAHYDLPTIRQTLYGPVEGITEISALGQKYYAFKGIPFAEPPITGRDPYTGEQVDRRFKAPEELKRHWTKPLKVQKFANLCSQSEPIPKKLFSSFNFSEDCLYLDVFIPADGVENKPVLTFIHGIGEASGTADEKILGPDFLLSQDCVVVKLAYRSGMFGWLNLGHGNYTGNMALKDQQLGAKWVYENIENFSGNKKAILLFGHSFAGSYVNYQMLSTVSRRYFTRAFCMSGTSFNPFYNLDKNNQLQLAKKCFQINDTEKLIEYLKSANRSSLFKCNTLRTGVQVWLPTIESPDAPDAFLTKTPDKIYNSNEAPVLDTMFSVVNQEAIHMNVNLLNSTKPILNADSEKSYNPLPFAGFTKRNYPKEYKQADDLLEKVYFPDTMNVQAIQNENIAFMSDLYIRYSTLKAVILQSKANNNNQIDKNGNKNTFLFMYLMLTSYEVYDKTKMTKTLYFIKRFSVNTDINPFQLNHHVRYSGATHSDDLVYIFCAKEGNLYDVHLKNKDDVYDLIMRTEKYIANFARTGDPTIEQQTSFKNCKSSDKIFCTDISNNLKSFVMTDIKKQFHYDTWLKVEKLYESINKTTNKENNLN